MRIKRVWNFHLCLNYRQHNRNDDEVACIIWLLTGDCQWFKHIFLRIILGRSWHQDYCKWFLVLQWPLECIWLLDNNCFLPHYYTWSNWDNSNRRIDNGYKNVPNFKNIELDQANQESSVHLQDLHPLSETPGKHRFFAPTHSVHVFCRGSYTLWASQTKWLTDWHIEFWIIFKCSSRPIRDLDYRCLDWHRTLMLETKKPHLWLLIESHICRLRRKWQ